MTADEKRAEYLRRYREKLEQDPERAAALKTRARERSVRYRAKNADRLREERRQKRVQDPETARAQDKGRYQRRKAAHKVAAARYYKLNKSRMDHAAQLRAGMIFAPGETRESIFTRQGGCCAICRGSVSGKRIHVDHCHDTGRVRGVLCHLCNPGLGYFQDDPELLRAAADYLTMAEKMLG